MSEDGTKEYWQTLRTFTAKTGESGVPASSGFVANDWAGDLPEEIEIRFDTITTANSPTSVHFDIWRLLDSKVDRIYRISYDSADFSAPIPTNLRFDGEQVYVTCAFTGGASPTVTTVCQCRVIK